MATTHSGIGILAAAANIYFTVAGWEERKRDTALYSTSGVVSKKANTPMIGADVLSYGCKSR